MTAPITQASGPDAQAAGRQKRYQRDWPAPDREGLDQRLQALHKSGVDVGYVLLSIAKNDDSQTLASGEQALLETYRAAANEQAKTTARNVLAAAAGSF